MDGRPAGELAAGCSFGKAVLLHDGVRIAALRAAGTGVVWQLAGDDVLSALGAQGRTAADLVARVLQDSISASV